MMHRTLLVLALASSVAACGTDAEDAADEPRAEQPAGAASSSSQADEDLQDIQEFELTMDRIDKYIAAQRSLALAAKNMSEADREAASMSMDQNASLDDMVRATEASEVTSKAARDAGLSPREYVMIGLAYFQSAMASAVMQMQPNANQDSLAREMEANPANINFIKVNEAELTAKFQAAEDELKRLGVTDN
jgi:hypothetical protein